MTVSHTTACTGSPACRALQSTPNSFITVRDSNVKILNICLHKAYFIHNLNLFKSEIEWD